ncbi:recombinase family protein [Nesterenkonia alkaliphila]|uniref:Recombinase family protein n=1 Tax=Nesterenkonia alkaliphila TaxID=1463631 RepID=A0A7K1UFN6_9MICC|nr:recombinase family protein [Nesterenkonia alkaliphila]
MNGQRIGYVRVNPVDQNDQGQLDGEVLDRIFTEEASGMDTDRPELVKMIRFVRDRDTVVVHSMDRLARHLEDLRSVVGRLTGKGVRVEFCKENLVFTEEDCPMATLMLSVLGALAEFDRSLIKERQREAIALARRRVVHPRSKRT